ncbi:MAG: hypothetical protein WBW88_13860 [Rhodothermales bacterium]
MSPTSFRLEIDHHTLKLIVGVMAISLALLTAIFSDTPLDSISDAYYEVGKSRDILVGFLFAIAAFLLAYNGRSKRELVLSKVAAISAMGVALFPCGCGGHPEIVPGLHIISAVTMFLILAFFCWSFYQRAKTKKFPQARFRSILYLACGGIILLSMATMAADLLLGDAIGHLIPRLTFWGEAAALTAFGVAWLTASRILPFITHGDERLSILP